MLLFAGADEYKELFNNEADSLPCLRLVPRLTSEPVLRNTGEELDLVYSVSYVSEDHTVHVSKIRKMSLINSIESLIKGKGSQKRKYKHKFKRGSDYSFTFQRLI